MDKNERSKTAKEIRELRKASVRLAVVSAIFFTSAFWISVLAYLTFVN